MRQADYIAEPSIVTAVHLARAMEKPLLVEGDAGVGKTEIAKVMATLMQTELIRLQCYEGLDVNTALYEWNYQKQLLRLRMGTDEAERDPDEADPARAKGVARDEAGDPGPANSDVRADHLEGVIFGRRYLLERPLLRAITRDTPPVLLIDEIDRADEGFEAFLLEVLSDFQVTIPELGTIRATHRPLVVLTSNRSREIGDALRRRCLYLYIEHPTFAKEVEIIRAKLPGISDALAAQITHVVQGLRARRLMKPPGVAETLDWARALVTLHQDHLDAEIVSETLGCLVKDRHDISLLHAEDVETLLAGAGAG
ncbi:MAG: MoxR family ATPase [Gammaproteobacteria bacterium]|nr:MoxR family ATPase [Gammaproteobacteria bacterium]